LGIIGTGARGPEAPSELKNLRFLSAGLDFYLDFFRIKKNKEIK
jgi:hypothetical protein